MGKLVLVRHGQSQWNLENRFTGWVDVPLTEQGRAEARRSGRALRDTVFDQAFTSGLQRAAETLQLVLAESAHPNVPIATDDALNERHYGDLQGLNKDETAAQYGADQVHIWRRSYDVRPPGGESLADTAARTLPYFEQHIAPRVRRGESVLVVAHGNSLRSIVMDLEALNRDQVMALNIPTGVPIVYDLDGSGAILAKTILEE